MHVPKHYTVYYKYIQLLSVGRLQKQKNVYMNTKNHKKGPLYDVYISFQKDFVDLIQIIEEIFCAYFVSSSEIKRKMHFGDGVSLFMLRTTTD